MVNIRELSRVPDTDESILYTSDAWSVHTLYLAYPKYYKLYNILLLMSHGIVTVTHVTVTKVTLSLFTKSKIRKRGEKKRERSKGKQEKLK